MVKAVIERDQMTNPKFQQTRRKSQKNNEQSFYVHFEWPDLGPPTDGCPNQIVLVGWGFLPRTAYIIW